MLKARVPTALPLALVIWVCAGCTNGFPTVKPECAPPTSASSESATRNGSTSIEALNLSFRLPPIFRQCEDPELVFLAKSVSPPAVFSIAKDTPTVIDHEAEGQETVAPADIEGVDAVIVTDAVVEGLPAGVSARELLVATEIVLLASSCQPPKQTSRGCGRSSSHLSESRGPRIEHRVGVGPPRGRRTHELSERPPTGPGPQFLQVVRREGLEPPTS